MALLTIDGPNQQIEDTNGNELLKFGETASAVNEPTLTNAATGNNPRLSATGGDSNIGLSLRAKGTGGVQLEDGNGNEVLKCGAAVASAVNEITVQNAATGNPPELQATGGDTNIDVKVTPKGTGALQCAGPFRSPVTTVQDLTNGATITLPTGGRTKRLSASGGAVTGIILTVGRYAGDEIVLFNIEGTNTITFAAAGTSNVADGTSAVIGALRALLLTWDATSSRWYRTG